MVRGVPNRRTLYLSGGYLSIRPDCLEFDNLRQLCDSFTRFTRSF